MKRDRDIQTDMTSFNISENIQQVEDPAMNNCSGPILVDASSMIETYVVISSNTAAALDTNGQSSYNGIETIFQTDISPATRVRLDKSYLAVTYTVGNYYGTPAVITPVQAQVSIPWNTTSALLERCSYSLNVANIDIENHTSYFGHGNMIKMLTTYNARALEAAEDRFFTPCIEQCREMYVNTNDSVAGISPQATTRAKNWLATPGVAGATTGKKTILLADMFDSMRTETAWYIQRLVLRLYFKQPNNILFRCSPSATAASTFEKFYITDVKLNLCLNTLSADQIDIEREKVEANESIMRNAYRVFDVITVNGTDQTVYQQPAIKNMQAAVMMISSPHSLDGKLGYVTTPVPAGTVLGVNPYQYCYGATMDPTGTTSASTGVTSYHQRYDNYYSPMSLVVVQQPPNCMKNTEMYEYWRYLTRVVNDRHEDPPVKFKSSMANLTSYGPTSDTTLTKDLSPYVFFASSFCNQDTAPRKLVAGGTHEVRLSNSSGNYQFIIVRIRMGAIEITGDTQIHLMI
jgi:hypothetical protein